MNTEEIVKSYFQNLEQGNYQGIIELFQVDAVVISPLYGEKKAVDFYKELFSDTSQSKITLKNIFVNTHSKNVAAAHFLYEWTMKDGNISPFECVDVFNLDDHKITKLTIIYDSYQTRMGFNNLKTSSARAI